MKVVISGLTYVNFDDKCNYICLMLDLCNRKIVEYAASKNGNTNLVEKALKTFNINRSLNAKGCPYDNAVAEATYKIIKTEFAFNKKFESLEELELELFDYVNWYNNMMIHDSLGYMTLV